MPSPRPCVFLLPGMLSDAAIWEPQTAALQADYELVIPSYRGFDDFVAMARYTLTLAPARFSVVAHSMGGRVAMELLRLAGERINKVVLMDMGVHPVGPEETLRNQQLLTVATEGGLAAVADSWIPFMLHPARTVDKPLTNQIRAMVLRHRLSDLQHQLRAAQQRADQSQYLGFIQHKVHILCGEADNWNTPEQHRRMHAQLANSVLEVLPDCGHMSPLEQPAQVNAFLLQWLAG